MVFAGFLTPLLLLSSAVLAYRAQRFADIGWRGGEYARAFIGVAIGAILLGGLLRLLRPRSPWSSFGFGMVLAGVLGIAIAIAIMALFIATL